LNSSTFVAVGLGSNLGDREAHLAFAFDRLAALFSNLRISTTYDTLPVDVPDLQPRFLNAAAVGETILGAREVLVVLLAIERERGRERPFPGAARTLDLDLLLYGSAVLHEPGLTIPHPHFRDRRFVLEPLAEIAPDLRDPVTSMTVVELLERLPRSG
jgi:2-amino-4-hydroxy-6-hydroxymethyldihydropteridine diphosphokinase